MWGRRGCHGHLGVNTLIVPQVGGGGRGERVVCVFGLLITGQYVGGYATALILASTPPLLRDPY